MDRLTSASIGLTAHLQAAYGFTVEPKEDSTLMKAVAYGMAAVGWLGIGGVPDTSDFLTRYATTITTTMYLPKTFRDSPATLLEVVPHECCHVRQNHAHTVLFPWLYLENPSYRVQYETDAYATGLAVRCWLTGRKPDEAEVDAVVAGLVKGYHLRAQDAAQARASMLSHMESIRDGIYNTEVARKAIAYLEANYPDLKGSLAA